MNALELKAAYRVLNRDAILKRVIAHTGPFAMPPKRDTYTSLLQSIVYQQLSTKAADTIWKRFLDLFPEHYPAPDVLLHCDTSFLRSAGISAQKAAYLQHIAQAESQGKLNPRKISKMEDELVINHFTEIKGVGRWTAQMTLMFSMGRRDVFPSDDLGIRSVMKELYFLDASRAELTIRITEIAQNWRPYRTLASLHLWSFRSQFST